MISRNGTVAAEVAVEHTWRSFLSLHDPAVLSGRPGHPTTSVPHGMSGSHLCAEIKVFKLSITVTSCVTIGPLGAPVTGGVGRAYTPTTTPLASSTGLPDQFCSRSASSKLNSQ